MEERVPECSTASGAPRGLMAVVAIASPAIAQGEPLTVAVGVATLDDGSADDIKDRADAALYRAKEAGRNQVVMA